MSKPGGTGAGSVVALAWLSQVALALVLTVVMGRTLDAADFGLFALAAATLGFAREASDLGSTVAAARSISGPAHQARSVLLGLLVVRGAIGLIASAAALTMATMVTAPGTRGVSLALAGALLLLPCGAFQALFIARRRQLGASLWGAGTQAAVLAGCLLLVAAQAPGWTIALAVVAREAAWLLGLAVLGLHMAGPLTGRTSAIAAARGVVAAVGLWAAVALLRHLLNQVELVAVTLAGGAAEAGAWSAAARILAPVAALTGALAAPLVPALAKARASQAGPLIVTTLQMATVWMLLLASAGVAVAGESLDWLYGGAWGGPGSRGASMLALLAATTVPMVVGTLAGLALLGLHRERLALLALVPALVLKIVACLIWVPTGGALAAAAISLVVECALATALLLALCRALREAGVAWRVTAADMAAWMAAAVWPALVANAWPGDGAARVLVAAIAVVLGAGLAWALMPGRQLRQAWRAVHPDIDGRPAQEPH